MKVADVMQKHVESVSSDAKVLDVARIIFGRNINGLPVCDGKKIVGFVSETDILSKFHPTIQEYTEDPFTAFNFEGMEEKIKEILALTAKDIMSKRLLTINKDDPLLQADSLMRLEGVGRLPVVDNVGNLVGIITMGDIFKSLVGNKMPYLEAEEYHDWIAKHFDLATGWESRIPSEIPSLVDLFRKKGIKKVLDMGCGTGEHAIALAENGFEVLGMESSRVMFGAAQSKWKSLSRDLRHKIKFVRGDYVENLRKIKGEYQAAIFMGNAMAHMTNAYKEILKQLDSVLPRKNAVIVSQLINFEKPLKTNRLERFVIKQSGLSPSWQHAYIWFYDPPKEKEGLLTLNVGILDYDGRKWSVRGMNSVQTTAWDKRDLKKIFEEINFLKTNFFGSDRSEPLLAHESNVNKNYWLTVVAER